MNNYHIGREIKIRIAYILAAVMIILVPTGCSLLPIEDRALQPPLEKPAQAKIETVEVMQGDIVKSVSGTGSFESVRMGYHQFTEFGGRVSEVLVRSGDTVKAGDVLLSLERQGQDMELLQKRLEVEKKELAMVEAKETGNSRRIHIAGLELEIANMGLHAVENELSNMDLIAEMDGIVVFVADLEAGDIVERFRTLITIADPKEMRLSFNTVRSNVLSDIKVGFTAAIEFDDQSYQGKVVQTPATAPYEEDERLMEKYSETVYIELETLPEDVEIGDTASIEIVTAEKNDVMIIRKNGLRSYFGRTYVQVLEGESRRELDVESGLETATEVEIINGLEVGQLVILQ